LEYFDRFVTEPGDSEALGQTWLSFVFLLPVSLLSSLLAKKSFFDPSGRGVRNRTIFTTQTTPIVSCGMLVEQARADWS
jgi:hypothetical protein